MKLSVLKVIVFKRKQEIASPTTCYKKDLLEYITKELFN